MIELAAPWALALLPLPLIVALLAPAAGAGGNALHVPARIGQMLEARAASLSAPSRLRGLVLPALIWALAILAVAGPRQTEPVPALQVSGRDLAIVLDLSGSMVREDFFLDGAEISRLEAVTRVGASFARGRAGDRLALIVFGSEAYYAAPFTFDTEAVARRIEEATIGISGRATNISDGLGLALKRMATSEAESRVVILLSDGSNNAGATKPLGVAQLARSQGVRVHTIALGPKDETTSEEGERGVVDAAALRAMSEVSGGAFFRVRTTEDLAEVASALDALEPTAGEGLAAEVYRDFWPWFGAGALGLLLLQSWRQRWDG